MNDEQRIQYYLGERLGITSSIGLDDYPSITLDTLTDDMLYHRALRELLTRCGYEKRRFCFSRGDIQVNESLVTLVKNRYNDHMDSVILRCLNFQRHWERFYRPFPDRGSWMTKKRQVFWRGTTTGQPGRPGNRFDLIERWFKRHPSINIGFSFICQGKEAYRKYVVGQSKPFVFLQYRYLLSIPGNDKDSGLNWKLNSSSVVLMARPRITTWLMESTLIPDYHYVLLRDDYSDLVDKCRWCEHHPKRCLWIIANANRFMRQFANQAREKKIEEEVIHRYFAKVS